MYRHIYAIAGILVVLTAASIGSTHAKSAASSALQVVVTNPSTNPVPVVTRGPVSLANDQNNPLPVRDVDAISRTPVRFAAGVGWADGTTSAVGNDSYTVPSGKTLVVQSIIADSYRFPGGEILCEMGLAEKFGIDFSIPVQDQGKDADGFEHFTGNFIGTLYFPSGTILAAYGTRNDGTNEAGANIIVTGYLVNAS